LPIYSYPQSGQSIYSTYDIPDNPIFYGPRGVTGHASLPVFQFWSLPPKVLNCPSDDYVYWDYFPASHYGACTGPTLYNHASDCGYAQPADYSSFASLPGIASVAGPWGATKTSDVLGCFGLLSYSSANKDAGNNVHIRLAADIPDGTSTTIALGEMLPIQSTMSANWGWCGALTSNGGTLAPINFPTTCFDTRWTCDDRNHVPCSPTYISSLDYQLANGFKSKHPGGANFCFADASVHFLSQNISMTLYQYLGCRNDGQAVKIPD
jgi:prepilin-type processing-associated H-X9-DG protein